MIIDFNIISTNYGKGGSRILRKEKQLIKNKLFLCKDNFYWFRLLINKSWFSIMIFFHGFSIRIKNYVDKQPINLYSKE